MPKPEPDPPSPSTLWWRVAACVFGLVMLGNLVLGPLYSLATRKPAALPPRIRAIEGNVLIAGYQGPGDDGAYLLQTAHGKSLTLYCGPWPYSFRCLNRLGLERGSVYRLTIAYSAEVFPDGQRRNVITHVLYGDHDLLTPQDQLRAWNQTVSVYNARRGERIAMKLDGLFWALQAFTGAIYAMFIVALIKNGLALARLYTGRWRV